MSDLHNKVKVAMVSTLLPSGHYTQVLCSGLSRYTNLLIYADMNKENLKVKGCGKIKLVWGKNIWYIFNIVNRILKDKPDIVHLQHEINMFGSSLNAALFPVLPIIIRLLNIRVVVTIHAVVSPKQINNSFAKTFNFNNVIFKPTVIKLFFKYLYRSITWSSDLCFVHTTGLKNRLVNEYGVSETKIEVIKHPIYQYKVSNEPKKEKYFFYFGYMVRRKGLDKVIKGFKNYIEKHPKTMYRLKLAGGTIKGQEKSKNEIIRTIEKSNLVKFIDIVGFLDERQQDDLYKGAYAVIVPSVLSIAASGPLCHARGYGKCIIASNVGTLTEEINNNIDGILTNNNKWENAFEYAINNPINVSKYEKQSIFIAKQRSPVKTASQLVKIYQEIR